MLSNAAVQIHNLTLATVVEQDFTDRGDVTLLGVSLNCGAIQTVTITNAADEVLYKVTCPAFNHENFQCPVVAVGGYKVTMSVANSAEIQIYLGTRRKPAP